MIQFAKVGLEYVKIQMKKVGIITHYDVHNHGAILQLNALIQVLREQFSIDAKALQFDKNYDFLGHEMKAKYDISLKSVAVYLKYLKERGCKSFLFNYRKRKILNNFKSKHGLIGKYYTDTLSLDAVIIGSDEVFALHTGPTSVFFGHACPSNLVFSYAGCFGPTSVADIKKLHCEAFVSSGLLAMKGVSVRDKNSQSIVRKLTGIDAKLVCDPVILYGYGKEISCMKTVPYPPYLLVYAYDNRMNDEEEIKRIKKYAKSKGLKILSPGFYHSWCDYNVNVNPVELLGYFKSAKEILTDTFHGSVMSIITNANFVVKTRDNGNKLLNLLEEYGLQSRVIKDFDHLGEVLSKSIDYTIVNDELARRREDSLLFLKEMMKGV